MSSVLPSSARNVLLAVNPRAGARAGDRHVDELWTQLQKQGLTVHSSTDLDSVTRQARLLHSEGRLRCLVAMGGDGTAAELVNRTIPGLPIAVYPLGTANLLANYIGVWPNPMTFARMVGEGSTIQFDCGLANGRIFLLLAGCGFDAEVVRLLHERRSGHISKWSYAKPILAAIRRYKYPLLRVSCEAADGHCQAWSRVARWAFIANLPPYGGGLQFNPLADGTDGLLNVCTFNQGSLWHGLRYLSFVLARQHRRLRDCQMGSGCRLRIEADDPELNDAIPYQLDGDPGGVLPLEIEVLPGRLTLIIPTNCRIRKPTVAVPAQLAHQP